MKIILDPTLPLFPISFFAIIIALVASRILTKRTSRANSFCCLTLALLLGMPACAKQTSHKTLPEAAPGSLEEQLLTSAREGQLEVVIALMDSGVVIDAANKPGWTALLWAAGHGHVDVVRVLLLGGADVDARLISGFTALGSAAQGGHADVVRVLLEAGAEVDAATNSKRTPLYYAARSGDLESVRLLVQAGADVNRKERYGHDPLTIACSSGAPTQVILELLQAGADVTYELPRSGWTALMYAAFECSIESVQALIDAGADIHAKDRTIRMSVIMHAATGGRLDVVQLLRQNGARDDRVEENLLVGAARNGQSKDVLALLEAGVGINSISHTPQTQTALMASAHESQTETVQVLIERGANVNAEVDGITALHWATRGPNPRPVIRMFIDVGADLNMADDTGLTPLMWVVKRGFSDFILYGQTNTLEIVKNLVQAGADIHRKNKSGETAVDIANGEIERYLREASLE